MASTDMQLCTDVSAQAQNSVSTETRDFNGPISQILPKSTYSPGYFPNISEITIANDLIEGAPALARFLTERHPLQESASKAQVYRTYVVKLSNVSITFP